MARRPKNRKSTNLKYRLLSAVILIPLSLYLIYLGPPYSLVLGGIVVLGLFVEWVFLCVKNSFPFWRKLSCIVLGTLYLLLATLWIFQYLLTPEGWKLLYWLLFLVWSTDSFAYAGGSLLKGPKLVPSISPNKTWSGFMSGMIGGTAIGFGTSFWLVPLVFNLPVIILLVFIAQGGDLLESLIKRWSNVKDSGLFIPGHGGFLDRLDSFLAVSFALALWQIFHL